MLHQFSSTPAPSLSGPMPQPSFTSPWGVVLTILLCVALMAGQSYVELRQADQTTRERLHNNNNLVGASFADRFTLIRQALADMDQLADMPSVRDAATTTARLQQLRAQLDRLLPGAELALLAPDGATLAETDQSVRNGIPALPALLAKLGAGGTSLQPGDTGPTLLVLKPHRARNGQLGAVLVLALPYTGFSEVFERLTVIDGGRFTLLDGSGRTLAEHQGAATRYSQAPQAAEQRLHAVTDLALPWAGADARWQLRYSASEGTHQGNWIISTTFNVCISLVLIALVVNRILIARRNQKLMSSVATSLALLRRVLDSGPAPLVLVNREHHTIELANAALAQRFGALAGQGESIANLFQAPADWQQLRTSGHADSLPMLGRAGVFHAQLDYVALDMDKLPGPQYSLLSVTDVTVQQKRIDSLQTEALRDPLTGLPNRRCFNEASAQAVLRAASQQRPLAVLALDLDFFKRVNDSYGHAAGDRVLVATAQTLRATLRENDLPARLGGEEFVVLLPDTELGPACSSAERIRLALASSPIVLDDGQVLQQTVSIGVAMLGPEENDLQAALERADAALYRAKEQGRNRVERELP